MRLAMIVDANKGRRTAGTRARLLSVARTLFAERGFAGASTEQLVERAGVTRGALYYHFRDKRDIFRAVFEQVEEDVNQRMTSAAMAEAEPGQALDAGCRAFLDACLDPAVQRIALVEAPTVLGWAVWHEIASQHSFGLLVLGLEVAISTGDIDDQPVAALAHALLGALNEGALFIARADDRERARQDVGAVVSRVLRGLKAD
jgi:AcrR family transcriptional regulator